MAAQPSSIAQLSQGIETYRARLRTVVEEKTALTAERDALQQRLAPLQAEVHALGARLADSERRVDETRRAGEAQLRDRVAALTDQSTRAVAEATARGQAQLDAATVAHRAAMETLHGDLRGARDSEAAARRDLGAATARIRRLEADEAGLRARVGELEAAIPRARSEGASEALRDLGSRAVDDHGTTLSAGLRRILDALPGVQQGATDAENTAQLVRYLLQLPGGVDALRQQLDALTAEAAAAVAVNTQAMIEDLRLGILDWATLTGPQQAAARHAGYRP